MSVQFDRVAQLTVSLVSGKARVASGYLLAERLVLTAAHVDQGDLVAPIHVSLPYAAASVSGSVVWSGSSVGLDAALIELAGPPTGPRSTRSHLVRWGRLTGQLPGIRVTAVGFPRVLQANEGGRVLDQLKGWVNPGVAMGQRYDVNVEGALPLSTAGGRSQWSGLSGAALFSGKFLIGVLVIDIPQFQAARLTAVPAWRLLAEQGFAAVVRRHGCSIEVESVELSGLFDRPPRSSDSPASLLRADKAIVRFRGREQELDELQQWCTDEEPLAVALVTGQGGQGKTRLARELCLRMRDEGWLTGFVSNTDRATRAAGRLADSQLPVLVAVDYAETRPEQVCQLVEAAEEPNSLVRLLLLARAAGNWWDDLLQDLRAAPDPDGPRALSLLEDSAAGRARAYRDALHDFAVHLAEIDGGISPWMEIASELSLGDVQQSSTATVLQIHTSALIALLQAGPRPVSAQPSDEIEDILLRHEHEYWRKTAAGRRLDYQPETLRNAVAVASLCGAVTPQEALATLPLVRGLGGQPEDRLLGVASWLHELYPPADDQYWGSLQPDRLAEHLAGRISQADPDFIVELLAGISDTQKYRVFRVFDRAAGHQPHLADVWSPLERIILIHGDDPAFDADVRRELLRPESSLFALGQLATGDAGDPVDLLHCEVPVGGETIKMLPVFTRIEHIASAVLVNPTWQGLDVLPIEGRMTLDDLGEDEWLGINPWSGNEFKLPPVSLKETAIQHGLEQVIRLHGDDPAYDADVRQELLRPGSNLLALGQPATGNPAAAHLLHCEVPVGGETIKVLPVFTRIEHIAPTIRVNPSWQSLHVLQMDAQVVLNDLGEDEWLAINPWSGNEFKLPPGELPAGRSGELPTGVGLVEEASAHREALHADPGNAVSGAALGKALRDLRRFAITFVNTAEGETPIWLRRFGAAAAYRQALRVDPDNAAARLGLGDALSGLGEHEEAAAAYREALRVDPGNVTAHVGLGNALTWLDRYEEAAAAYRQALRVDPGDAAARLALGDALSALDRYEEAAAAYRQALSVDPDNAAAHMGLGYVLIHLGRFEQAAAAWRDALRMDPGNAAVYSNLGWHELYVRGDVRAAERLLSEAMRLDSTFTTTASENLVAALVAKGDQTAARELLAQTIAHQRPPSAQILLWQWLLARAEGSPGRALLPQILAALNQASPPSGRNRFSHAEMRAVALLGLEDDSAAETLRSAIPMRTLSNIFFRPKYDLLATPEPPQRLRQLLDVWREIIAADSAAAGAWGSPDPH